jgi:hypothetical protein
VPLFAGASASAAEHDDPELIEWVSGLLAAIFPPKEPVATVAPVETNEAVE